MEKVPIYDLLRCFSSAIDMVTPEITNHHNRVGYLVFRLGEYLNWKDHELEALLSAGLIHDIGALSIEERLSINESEDENINLHAFRGAKLLMQCPSLASYANMIKYHHIPWQNGKGKWYEGKEVPKESHLIYLADRICSLIKKNKPILIQLPGIAEYLKKNSGEIFNPEYVDAALKLSEVEHIWLEFENNNALEYLPKNIMYRMAEVSLDGLVPLARIFARIIDFRSRYTATHSAGVAFTAEWLARLFGFSKNECKMMLIAGYLHDLGKLTIDNSLLEKPGALSKKEFDIIRTHTFYTYEILKDIKGFKTINKWASYHHERLDGNGYPFHLKDDEIPIGSRIMAVADIFTAVTEPRPYRPSMERSEVIDVLRDMAENGAICKEVVRVVAENLEDLTTGCIAQQNKAAREFEEIYKQGLNN